MNCFVFSGRIGCDAEVGSTQGGTAVCNFPVAVESGYGDNKQTTWVRCALWGKRAEGGLPQYLTKGAQVVVSGELSTREYQKKDGSQGFSVEIRVSEITLVGGKPDNQGGYQQQGSVTPASQYGLNPGQQAVNNAQPRQGYRQAPQNLDYPVPF